MKSGAQSCMGEGRKPEYVHNYIKMDFAGFNGLNAALAVGTSYGSSKISGAMLGPQATQMQGAVMNSAVGTALSTGVEYYKYQNWGAENSNYASLARPDLGAMGGLAGSLASIGINQKVGEQVALYRAEQARQAGNTAQAAMILAGAGFSRSRRDELLDGYETQQEAAAAEQHKAQQSVLKKYGVASPEALEAKFKGELFLKQTTGGTNAFLAELAAAGLLTEGMVQHVNEYRQSIKGDMLAQAQAQYGVNHPLVQQLKQEAQRAKQPTLDEVSRALFGNTYYAVAQAQGVSRYIEAHRAAQVLRTAGGLNTKENRDSILRQYLNEEEMGLYYSEVLPQLEANSGSNDARWIGAKNYMFDRQTDGIKMYAAAATAAEWSAQSILNAGRSVLGMEARDAGTWRQMYESRTAARNAAVVEHYGNLNDIYRGITSVHNPATAAGIILGIQSDINDGRTMAGVSYFAAESMAMGFAGRALQAGKVTLPAVVKGAAGYTGRMGASFEGVPIQDLVGYNRALAHAGLSQAERAYVLQAGRMPAQFFAKATQDLQAATGRSFALGLANMKGIPPLRQQYMDEVMPLSDKVQVLKKLGLSTEDMARIMNMERRTLGVQYKGATPEPMLSIIYSRNIARYGDRLGPTITSLRDADKTWGRILDTSSSFGGGDLGF